jgi:sugar phosphate isomerase/epimerase
VGAGTARGGAGVTQGARSASGVCPGPEIQFELDLGWIRRAGEEPMEYWRSCRQRVPQIHLRDFDAAKEVVCDVGTGFLDVAAVGSEAARLGTRLLIYEQDRYPVSPLASAEACARTCRAAGLVRRKVG